MSGYQIPHFGLKRQYKNIGEELLDASHRALKDGQLVGGHYTRSFEEWLKHRTKTKYAVTVHSGTQALEIIARYKKSTWVPPRGGLLQQPKIILPNLTYPATLNAFLNAGWDVTLGDTDKHGILSYNSQKIGFYNCLVGFAGMKPWEQSRIENSVGVIVDGAQHWLVADGQIGAGMAISFDPTKNLPSSGNGGAIVTNDEHLYLYAVRYRDNNKPDFYDVGTNSKMSEQDCAQILVRAKYIDEWQKRRSEIAKYWCDSFRDLPGLTCLSDTPTPHAHQKFVLYLPDRNSLHTHLLTEGIDSKIHYEYVLGDLPTTRDLSKPDMISTSVMLSRGVLSLPLYPELTDEEVDFIAEKVISYAK